MAPWPRCQSMPLLDTATPAQSPSVTLYLCHKRNADITKLRCLPETRCLGYVLWFCNAAMPICEPVLPQDVRSSACCQEYDVLISP